MAGVDKILVEYDAQTDAFQRRLKAIENTLRLTAMTGAKSAKVIEEGFKAADGSLEDLEDGLKDIEKQLKKTTDPKALKELGASFKEQKKQVDASRKSMKKLTGETKAGMKKLAGDITKIAGAIGIAFAADKLVSFGVESVKLAAKAEGIEEAFKRLNDPTLLDELKEATRGTVTEVELMSQAVRAKNLGVPIQKLGTFFEFATKRAAQTGEEVDFLVDSIVRGIGRKSTKILDNLGISAVALQDEMRKTGDFGQAAANIIALELEKAGDVTETTAQKMARLSAEWENFSTKVGKFLIDAGTGMLDFFDTLSKGMSGNQNQVDRLELAYDRLGVRWREGGKDLTEFTKLIGGAGGAMRVITEEGKALIKELDELEALEKAQAKSLRNFNEVQEESVVSLKSLNEELKAAKQARQEAAIGSESFVQAGEDVIDIENRIRIALGKESEAQKRLRLEREKAHKEFLKLLEVGVKEQEAKDKNERESLISLLEFEEDQRSVSAATIDEREEARIDAANQRASRALAATGENGTERILIEKQLQSEITDIEADAAEERVAIRQEEFDRKVAIANEALNAAKSVSNLLSTIEDKELADFIEKNEKRLENLQDTQEASLEALQFQLENRQITEQEFDNAKLEQEAAFAASSEAIKAAEDKKRRELQKKQAIRERTIAAFEIGINTAIAISTTGAQFGYPLAIPFVILAAIAGAAQLAAVLAAPLPGFAQGTKGKQGSGMAMVGERGPEAMFLPDGAKVLPNDKTVQNAGLIDAMYDNNLRSFINKNYVLPALKEQMAASGSEMSSYDDFGLKRAVSGGTKGARHNTDRIVRAIKGSNRNPLIAASRW